MIDENKDFGETARKADTTVGPASQAVGVPTRFKAVPFSLCVRRYGDKAVHCTAAHERIVADNNAS
jgi:hypothetical protein